MQQNHNKILVELINKTNSQNSKKFFKELDLKVKNLDLYLSRLKTQQ